MSKRRGNILPRRRVVSERERQMLEAARQLRPDIYGPTEPITETLIAELVANGWPEGELRDFQREGFEYNRARNSVCLTGVM